jgi:hypothetical protein
MTKVTRPTGTAGWFGVLSTAILLAGLFLASAWDGDGNPTTDNLPQATVTLAPRSVHTADEQTPGDEGDDFSDQRPRKARRLRHRRLALRELSWRRVAVPSRGPPEGGSDGQA